jgi:hypothetical protein
VCRQAFHRSCIAQWFQSHASCPNCRFNFKETTATIVPPSERDFDKFFDADVKVRFLNLDLQLCLFIKFALPAGV